MKSAVVLLVLVLILESCDSKIKTERRQIGSERITGNQKPELGKHFVTTPLKININEIPDEVQYEGEVKNAVRWTNNLVDNIVIKTGTGIYPGSKFEHKMDGGDAKIFAYYFLKSNGSFKRICMVYDYISDCPIDMSPHLLIKRSI